MARDRRQFSALRDAGWRVATIWEMRDEGAVTGCRLKTVAETCAKWLESDDNELGLEGDETRSAARLL